MEQQIRFCTTPDGVRIAYATVGDGNPLVAVSAFFGHLEFEWNDPDTRAFWEALAAGRLLVRYDKRGTGLSDWNAKDFSIEARVRDLESVIDAVGVGRFDLLGISEGGATSMIYAARHPDRVNRLILYGAYPRLYQSPKLAEPVLSLVRSQWGMGSAALAYAFVQSGDPDKVAAFTELQRAAATGDTVAEILEEVAKIDVTSYLERVQAPTLVVHRKRDPLHPFDLAREMAACIRDARLEPLEGDIYPPWLGDSNAVVDAVRVFLGGERSAPAAAEPTGPEGMTAILFADIADSTALTERLGDAAFRAKARDLDAALRTIIREHAGTPIEGKLLGDGVLAVFTSARQAIEAALACARSGDDAGLPLHLGLHAGDVIREDNNVYGGAVNIASRISGLSAPGEVLVSETVRSLARTSAGVSFEDRGERGLKGVGEPVRVWAVREAA
jgi:class 3 adenylate cyclase/pimeloyl-ACP methyl ester carboxylesterase